MYTALRNAPCCFCCSCPPSVSTMRKLRKTSYRFDISFGRFSQTDVQLLGGAIAKFILRPKGAKANVYITLWLLTKLRCLTGVGEFADVFMFCSECDFYLELEAIYIAGIHIVWENKWTCFLVTPGQ